MLQSPRGRKILSINILSDCDLWGDHLATKEESIAGEWQCGAMWCLLEGKFLSGSVWLGGNLNGRALASLGAIAPTPQTAEQHLSPREKFSPTYCIHLNKSFISALNFVVLGIWRWMGRWKRPFCVAFGWVWGQWAIDGGRNNTVSGPADNRKGLEP